MLHFVLVVLLMMSIVTGQVFAHSAKDPAAALTLGILFPGGGQIYNEQPVKALIPWGGFLVGGMVYDNADSEIFGIAIAYCGWIYSLFDAAMSADKINIEYHRRNRFGHLMEFDGDRVTVGVDPVTSRNRVGTMLSVRF